MNHFLEVILHHQTAFNTFGTSPWHFCISLNCLLSTVMAQCWRRSIFCIGRFPLSLSLDRKGHCFCVVFPCTKTLLQQCCATYYNTNTYGFGACWQLTQLDPCLTNHQIIKYVVSIAHCVTQKMTWLLLLTHFIYCIPKVHLKWDKPHHSAYMKVAHRCNNGLHTLQHFKELMKIN